jgi:hypothetical protein
VELLGPFADIEDIGLDLFATVGTTVLVTPPVITPPLVVVRRTGGADDMITDVCRLQVDTFGTSHRHTADMAERCRQLILAAPAKGFGNVSIDQVSTESAPQFIAYDDQHTHRYVATYRISLRRSR